MTEERLFDSWPERYEQWFSTPVGRLVKEVETELILKLVQPQPGEKMLDAGCGTGIFTLDFLARGSQVVGLDISRPMLMAAREKAGSLPLSLVQGDMLFLPFSDNSFDKAVSITTLEFIIDGQKAVDELFRVTRPGGLVVVATLNSLSPWAARRRAKTRKHILENAYFRSPDELLALSHYQGDVKTVVHFAKDEEINQARRIEQSGQAAGLMTGAFVAARWEKA